MLEIVNKLDGFESRGNVRVLSVCSETGMYAIRVKSKTISEKDHMKRSFGQIEKIIKGYSKISAHKNIWSIID